MTENPSRYQVTICLRRQSKYAVQQGADDLSPKEIVQQ